MRRRATDTYRKAYNTAREYPGTIAAVIVGLGITGFLLWAVRRSGGWRNLQADAANRMREGYDYARDGYERIKGLRQETLSE
ncbi:MAG TPA: hypothetical protein VEQ87_10030 [Burkholderiales bacterium]|nr:hypothetical protein [Burkholderiales bacterium]